MLKSLFNTMGHIGDVGTVLAMNPQSSQVVSLNKPNAFGENGAQIQNHFGDEDFLCKEIHYNEEYETNSTNRRCQHISSERPRKNFKREYKFDGGVRDEMVRGKKAYFFGDSQISYAMFKFHTDIKKLSYNVKIKIKNKQISNAEIQLDKKELLIQVFLSLAKTFANKNSNNVANLTEEQIQEIRMNVEKIANGTININEIEKTIKTLKKNIEFTDKRILQKQKQLEKDRRTFEDIFSQMNFHNVILESMLKRNKKGQIESFYGKTTSSSIKEQILNDAYNLGYKLTWEQEEQFYSFAISVLRDDLKQKILFPDYSYIKFVQDNYPYFWNEPPLVKEIDKFLREQKRKEEEKIRIENEIIINKKKNEIIDIYSRTRNIEYLDHYDNFLNDYSTHLMHVRNSSIILTVVTWGLAATYTGLSFATSGLFSWHAVSATITAGIMTYFTHESVQTYNEVMAISEELNKIRNSPDFLEFKRNFNEFKKLINQHQVISYSDEISYQFAKYNGLLSKGIEKLSKLIVKIPAKLLSKTLQETIHKVSLKIQNKIMNTVVKLSSKISIKKISLFANSWSTPVSSIVTLVDVIITFSDHFMSNKYYNDLEEIKKRL